MKRRQVRNSQGQDARHVPTRAPTPSTLKRCRVNYCYSFLPLNYSSKLVPVSLLNHSSQPTFIILFNNYLPVAKNPSGLSDVGVSSKLLKGLKSPLPSRPRPKKKWKIFRNVFSGYRRGWGKHAQSWGVVGCIE